MVRGSISRWKYNKNYRESIQLTKQLLDVNYVNDIPIKIKEILKENSRLLNDNKKLNDKLNKIMKEFYSKKIGTFIICRKYNSFKGGVLYFDKRYVGIKVVVWKKCGKI